MRKGKKMDTYFDYLLALLAVGMVSFFIIGPFGL